MTAAPGKSRPRPPKEPAEKPEPQPSWMRSIGFGVMLIAWWILTIELPAWNLFRIIANRGVDRIYAPITVWAFTLTRDWLNLRWFAVLVIIVATVFHYWLWYRRTRYDAWGKWLFRAAFIVLYIVLYGFFILIFIGAELPIYTLPPNLQDIPQ